MAELDNILRHWVAGLCTCRAIHSGIHNSTCPVGGIPDWEVENLAYDIEEWGDNNIDDAVAEAVDAARKEIHHATDTDQTSDTRAERPWVLGQSETPEGRDGPQG